MRSSIRHALPYLFLFAFAASVPAGESSPKLEFASEYAARADTGEILVFAPYARTPEGDVYPISVESDADAICPRFGLRTPERMQDFDRGGLPSYTGARNVDIHWARGFFRDLLPFAYWDADKVAGTVLLGEENPPRLFPRAHPEDPARSPYILALLHCDPRRGRRAERPSPAPRVKLSREGAKTIVSGVEGARYAEETHYNEREEFALSGGGPSFYVDGRPFLIAADASSAQWVCDRYVPGAKATAFGIGEKPAKTAVFLSARYNRVVDFRTSRLGEHPESIRYLSSVDCVSP